MQNIRDKYKSILVSGASGDIGIGIGRILTSANFSMVYGCDINTDSWGLCVFKEVFQIVRADSTTYLKDLKSLIYDLEIDLFIPSSESEIKVLNEYPSSLEDLLGCQVLITNEETICISLDKLATSNFLKSNGLLYPWTIRSSDAAPKEFPCIYKPISGQGSKGLEIIKDVSRLSALDNKDGYIFQELLEPEEQEFTCGVFRSKSGETRVINIKRTLSGGFTGKGTVVENTEIVKYVTDIGEALNVRGSINMQLRYTSKGPILFEINPRISSTVVFRHKLGFTDLIWAIEDLSELPISPYTKPQNGTTFYRGLSEYFVNSTVGNFK